MRGLSVLLIAMGVIITTFTGYNTIGKNQINRPEIISQQKARLYMTTGLGALLTISGLIMLVATKKRVVKKMSRSFY